MGTGSLARFARGACPRFSVAGRRRIPIAILQSPAKRAVHSTDDRLKPSRPVPQSREDRNPLLLCEARPPQAGKLRCEARAPTTAENCFGAHGAQLGTQYYFSAPSRHSTQDFHQGTSSQNRIVSRLSPTLSGPSAFSRIVLVSSFAMRFSSFR